MRIGIDLGGTKIEGILVDDQLQTLSRVRHSTPQSRGYESIIDTIQRIVDELESTAGQTCLIGIGTPGSISPETELIKNSNTLSLIGKPLKGDLEARLGREIRIQNDANCFALSEATDGAGSRHSVVFGVIIGTGVGGGIVVNKVLHNGPNLIAGEWGHNVLEANGPECYCGKKGCVETFLSGPGLVNVRTISPVALPGPLLSAL
jgi:fructokinase